MLIICLDLQSFKLQKFKIPKSDALVAVKTSKKEMHAYVKKKINSVFVYLYLLKKTPVRSQRIRSRPWQNYSWLNNNNVMRRKEKRKRRKMLLPRKKKRAQEEVWWIATAIRRAERLGFQHGITRKQAQTFSIQQWRWVSYWKKTVGNNYRGRRL